MGGCLSSASGGANILSNTDGNEEDFHKQYLEDRVLGEGEFGQVKMVHNMKAAPGEQPPLACKILRKGVVFRDNVLYQPLKPEILRRECDILSTLQGKHYCVKLVALYEAPKQIYMIQEYCAGGEMMEYVAQQSDELRTEDVSRIAFQLLDALHHCASHGVIHRDVKPDNCMFVHPTPGSELRLIDFGSGSLDAATDGKGESITHSTFAGSAFYISPEMFQRTYTSKTDVWSAGATLYVLVAGYPANDLQKAFNLMHTSQKRDLRKLPNFPSDLPDSFLSLLKELLQYRHKMRKSAGQLLSQEFVAFHKHHEKQGLSINDVVADSMSSPETGKNKTRSVKLSGSVQRHSAFLNFKKFERSVTTLLATLLSKTDYDTLLNLLKIRHYKHDQKLNIIPVKDLKQILRDDLQADSCLANINQLPNAKNYDNFAYHVDLLAQFVRDSTTGTSTMTKRSQSFIEEKKTSSVHGSNVFGQRKTRMAQSVMVRGESGNSSDGMNNSWHSGQKSGPRASVWETTPKKAASPLDTNKKKSKPVVTLENGEMAC